MNNFKKKALPAVLLLAGATASLGGVTYAWFSSNVEVSASKINVGVVDSNGGINICKTKDGVYSQEIDYESDTKKTTGEGSSAVTTYPHMLNPRSAANILHGEGTADRAFEFYNATVNPAKADELIASSVDSTIKEGDTTTSVWKLDMYFENTTRFDQEIYFNYTGEETAILNSFFPTRNDASMSVRIGIVYQGSFAHKTDDVSKDHSFDHVIIEPDALNHLQNAYVYKEVEDETTGAITRVEIPYTSATASQRHIKQDTWGIKGVIDSTSGAQPMRPTGTNQYLEKVTTKELKDVQYGASGATALFTLPKEKYSQVSFFIWLEGNDCDALDAAAGSPIAMNFNFKALKVTE